MLINTGTSFKKDDVITIKNVLGEEIICTFVSEDSATYTITNPLALGITQQGMTLIPPVTSGELKGEMKFAKAHTMWATLTKDEIVTGYKSQISEILVVTKSTKIIT